MGWRLASSGDAIERGFVQRFDARFWSVNFPRPMMAAVTTVAADALRVDAVFYRSGDLAGLIWEAEDRYDHPLLAYETARDFRDCRLTFRWRSGGVRALDAVHGPTLTIEGRDAGGAPRAWYVRLWNYAVGTPEDALVSLDFAALVGGFDLPADADPVWAGDVDRMFVSLVPPDYDGGDAMLAEPAGGWAEMSGICCDGPGAVLAIGDALVPAHGMRMATGYDDHYHLTPARLLRNMLHLGYRGPINHYVGMSHYFRLDGALLVTAAGGVLNGPSAAWHGDFLARAGALGYSPILSLSYELFDAHCPEGWKQRAADGSPALTGWVPPSTLLSPANAAAMAYLQAVAVAFVGIAQGAGVAVRFQVGEPWWWTRGDGTICLYDEAARAALGDPPVVSVRAPLDGAALAVLDAAGALLAGSTAALCAAVRAVAPDAETLLLVYLPTVLDRAAPELARANVPVGWARPAFDVLQIEDYDWVTGDNAGATAGGVAAMLGRLGYAIGETHYLSGFVLNAADRGQWRAIDAAAVAAARRGAAEAFFWALPQVLRDGFTHFDGGEDDMQAFDDVSFPIAIGQAASVEPGFSTRISTSASGHEWRNADWAEARLRFDAGPGVRSEAEVQALIGFFRARMGPARGFRFRDPFDDSSAGMTGVPGAGDQAIGTGDGVATRFALVKAYGESVRRITRPVAGSVRVAVDGIERLAGWALDGGTVQFDAAPGAGAVVTAGFRFDVPVRFAEDRLEVARATWAAGEMARVPLIEVKE
ncbi:DUF2460 domain-containing protein [Sphingomonas naphthae]|uniref:DUF2460 domain-containing protein n=1 Tax=Sphingomonas naphthae TaxID=1813468 RepID=A0ABY7TL57_9SPHN|nr:DUF2460 domain-containing protein [Sphingomonas naphthae]WCT73680.1 DUF2460 domain-containing protein [Sphingomonas naphthae]